MSAGSLRAGDLDRKAAADRLRVAFTEGRLQLMEYDERMAQVFASMTFDQLESVLADVPRSSSVDRQPRSLSSSRVGRRLLLSQRLPGWLRVLGLLVLTARDGRMRKVRDDMDTFGFARHTGRLAALGARDVASDEFPRLGESPVA